jgi:hypothetical protein
VQAMVSDGLPSHVEFVSGHFEYTETLFNCVLKHNVETLDRTAFKLDVERIAGMTLLASR